MSEPFVFGCSVAVFTDEEIELLKTHGHRLEAISAGAVPPATSEEQHFLLVDRDDANPETPLERAWVKLKGRREFEAEKPPDPPQKIDYGIIEWDKEKCWW